MDLFILFNKKLFLLLDDLIQLINLDIIIELLSLDLVLLVLKGILKGSFLSLELFD
jgi:hypothetical protein